MKEKDAKTEHIDCRTAPAFSTPGNGPIFIFMVLFTMKYQNGNQKL